MLQLRDISETGKACLLFLNDFELCYNIQMKKTIRKAFKFRLTPNSDQIQKMVEFSGANRFVWNKALAKNLSLLEQKKPMLWYQETNFWLGLWKSPKSMGF